MANPNLHKIAESILSKYIKGNISEYSQQDRKYHTVYLSTALQMVVDALKFKHTDEAIKEYVAKVTCDCGAKHKIKMTLMPTQMIFKCPVCTRRLTYTCEKGWVI